MRIGFDVAGTAAEFSWRGATGRVELRVGDDAVPSRAHSGSPPQPLHPNHPRHAGDAEHVVELVKVTEAQTGPARSRLSTTVARGPPARNHPLGGGVPSLLRAERASTTSCSVQISTSIG